jgi:hypothetical protein
LPEGELLLDARGAVAGILIMPAALAIVSPGGSAGDDGSGPRIVDGRAMWEDAWE